MNNQLLHKLQNVTYIIKRKRSLKLYIRQKELATITKKHRVLFKKSAYLVTDIKYFLLFIVFILALQPIINSNIQFAQAAPNPALSISGYIWENEDGSGADTVSQITAGDGTIEAPWGSRINLRAQLKNTGDALSGANLGLFYDKGDGHWTKANSGANKDSYGTLPNISVVDSSGDMGQRIDIAVDNNGNLWASYYANSDYLKVARYVGSGGTGCASTEWTCEDVDNPAANKYGRTSSIAINPIDNKAWVSYYDQTNGNLRLARYVGSGGTGCTISTWTCIVVDSTGDVGDYSYLSFDAKGKAYITYRDFITLNVSGNIKIAEYVGSGGTGCATTDWSCYILDSNGGKDVSYNTIDFDANNKAWVTYIDGTTGQLMVAEYVGSGGTGCNVGSSWNCYIVDDYGFTGDPALKIDKSGTPWISYLDGNNLSVAKYVGSGGSCYSTKWQCTQIDSPNDVGSLNSIDFDSGNNPWISYRDSTNDNVKVARYVGSGGTGCDITTWSCISMDADIFNSEGGFYPEIYIDSYDIVHLLFHHAGVELDLLYAKLTPWKTGGGCDNNTFAAAWDCYAVATTGDMGSFSAMALDSSGIPWIAYYNVTNADVEVAKYVGIGGNCSGSTKWQCSSVHTTNNVGTDIDIAIGANDVPWIATKDTTDNNLMIITLNKGAGNDCTNTSWDCYAVDTAGNVGGKPSITIDNNNLPWVSYWDATNTSLKVMKRVTSGGTGCAIATVWTCVTIDNTTDYGFNSYIAINPSDGNPWVAYNGQTTNRDLRIAKYDGAGNGICGADWACSTVYAGNVADEVSLAFAPSGQAWVAFQNDSTKDLLVAKEVGSGGTGCSIAQWSCSTIDNTGDVGQSANMVFDASGNPWVVYEQENAGAGDRLKVAQYTGANGTGCGGIYDWNCEYLDGESASVIGKSANIAIDAEGSVWASYYDATATDLKIAKLTRQGEVVVGMAQRYGDNAVISESHADMTSVTDTANRDDADCIGGGTWNNGLYSSSAGLNLLSLPAGNITPQCTEIVFTVDLTQVDIGANYRFMIATDDTWQNDKNPWRGISGSVKTPKLTVSDVSSVFSKDTIANTTSFCANSTTWYCEEFGNIVDTDMNSLAFAMSPDGVPWVAYFDDTDAPDSGDVYVANYVGTGGSNCGSGVTNWTCQKIFDTTNIANDFGIDMAFDYNGKLWIVFYHTNGNLYGVHYVGSGGTGCTTTAWQCEAIDTTQGSPGNFPSIAIDKNNNPWISSFDNANNKLVVSHYVGSGGNCTNTAWYCETVDNDIKVNVGRESAIAISPAGVPWVVAMSAPKQLPTVNETHYVIAMNYVGTGGTGCTSTAWQCYTLATRTDTPTEWSSFKPSIAFDQNGVPYTAFRNKNNPNIDTILAKFIGGTSQTSCGAGNTTAWDCTTIVNTNQESEGWTSLLFDRQNNPMIALATRKTGVNSVDVGLTRYVGSGGTGCSGTTAFSCELVDQDATNNFGENLTFRQDAAGYGWIISLNSTTNKIRVARSAEPLSKPTLSISHDSSSVMAYNTMGRYNNTLGKSFNSGSGQCNGTSDYFGACGYFHASGDYDSVVTQAKETPVFLGAQKYDTNAILPTLQWEGNTNLAPNTTGTTGDILLQVYRYGTTNSWETIASNTTSASCSTENCKLEATPSGAPTEYFELKNGKYWQYFRVLQIPSTTSITFKTDQLKATTNETRLRGGSYLQDGVRRPLNWR